MQRMSIANRGLRKLPQLLAGLLVAASAAAQTVVDTDGDKLVLKAGDPSLHKWMLPAEPPTPKDNRITPARVELGKMLFFDPRLSADGNMSCASCHNPSLGWSDALPTARGHQGKVLPRATPTITNAAYLNLLMWDGRKPNLEEQALGPMESEAEMKSDLPRMLSWLASTPGYQKAFEAAYPGEGVNRDTVGKAIATFQRTVITRNTRFDRWLQGDKTALTEEEVRGFQVFVDPNKGNCSVCHSAPNFSDSGFHNVGLASSAGENADPGRQAFRKVRAMKGAFKTPPLRDVSRTAPYFHDGSAKTLMEVVEHYVRGGDVKESLSPNMKPLTLTDEEKRALVAFMNTLDAPAEKLVLPLLPQ